MTTINWLMLFREIIAVYSEKNTKPIHNTMLCSQNAKLLNVKVGDTHSYHHALKS
jgi:hypothetical protein